MPLHIPTLLVAVALASAFCTVARVLLWWMHPSIPGLARWAWAGGLGTLALIFILPDGAMPWLLSLSIAQALIVAGLILVWDGFRRFVGRTPLSNSALAVMAIVVLTWLVAARTDASMEILASGNGILVAILSALIARELLAPPKRPLAMRATGWAYAANAGVFLIRVITAADHGAHTVVPAHLAGAASFVLLWWLGMIIAVTLGMALMTAERLQADLDSQANRDPLTGALNRRAFSLIAEQAVERSRRHGRPLSMLVMDLDRFKAVNDRLGHDAGDALLCRFVSVAGKVLRREDVFCRFGGEEFVALLPDASAEHARMAAERVRAGFARDSLPAGSAKHTPALAVTVSIGVGELEPDEDIESLLRRADAALYRAKRMGRDRCELADGALNDRDDDGLQAAPEAED